MAAQRDSLLLLRESIAKGTPPIPIKSSDASQAADAVPLEEATHLSFDTQRPGEVARQVLELSTPTRFVSQRDDAALDLLSIYFSWTNKDAGLTEYISAVQALTAARAAKSLGGVTNVVFTERVDLASWLNGESDESEFIKSLDDTAETRKAATGAADIARGAGDVVMGEAGALAGMSSRAEQERVRAIYRQERTLGDHNTILRGIKPTDFSHVRKLAEPLLRRNASRQNGPTPVAAVNSAAARPSKTSGRRPEPIILLSPSASSLLRLANIKSFLGDGVYSADVSSTGATILHIARTLPTIDPSRQTRFILVEGPENFKPDYWNRVVAVFTTGQAWQFKGYKWQHPADLFAHALGVYVGWRGEVVPDTVKGWGRGVLSTAIDKFRDGQTAQQRWRDREVVEEIWSAIEASMRSRGWGKEAR